MGVSAAREETKIMSIRSRLLIIAILATLVPGLLVGIRFFQDRANGINAARERLTEVAELIARDLDAKIKGTAQLLYGLARARDLENPDIETCSLFLSDVREQNPQYTGILTVEPNGSLFCDSLQSGRKLNLTDRTYFKRALAMESGVAVEATFGRLTGLAVLQIAKPVRGENGVLQYILLASFNLQKFAEGFDGQLQHVEILLAKNDGTVLAWLPKDKAKFQPGTQIEDADFAGQIRQAASGTGDKTAILASGETVWAFADTAAIAEAGLHVLVGLPKSELIASANKRLFQDIVTLVTVSLLLFAGVWALAEFSIRRQIARIAQMMTKLGKGELAARISPPYPTGDLGRLMALTNRAAQSLEQQRIEIEELHQQLRHAQKMEAIGHLTGGVAHDFNNLLTVVIGNAETMAERLGDQPTLKALAEMTGRAANRGADLTKRLLAFARRQPLSPKTVDVNHLISGMDGLLRRTLGEQIDISVVAAPDLWTARIDPSELENAILNLCINARDAMPQGGNLTISTANTTIGVEAGSTELEAGQYVQLTIADTGIGMDRATLERVFEPYFTTKEIGRGSGLGLSIVYGFVKQSRGHVQIKSEPGRGTSVRLYLPRDTSGASTKDEYEADGSILGGKERILLVEDDPMVKSYVGELLKSLGYQVVIAESAREALERLAADGAFDLVFTDIVMPGGMDGTQLAQEIHRRRPALPVLFTSGYSEKAVAMQSDGAKHFIAKPYRRRDLAAKLRAVLDQAREL